MRNEISKLARPWVAEEVAVAVVNAGDRLPVLQSPGLRVKRMTDGAVGFPEAAAPLSETTDGALAPAVRLPHP